MPPKSSCKVKMSRSRSLSKGRSRSPSKVEVFGGSSFGPVSAGSCDEIEQYQSQHSIETMQPSHCDRHPVSACDKTILNKTHLTSHNVPLTTTQECLTGENPSTVTERSKTPIPIITYELLSDDNIESTTKVNKTATVGVSRSRIQQSVSKTSMRKDSEKEPEIFKPFAEEVLPQVKFVEVQGTSARRKSSMTTVLSVSGSGSESPLSLPSHCLTNPKEHLISDEDSLLNLHNSAYPRSKFTQWKYPARNKTKVAEYGMYNTDEEDTDVHHTEVKNSTETGGRDIDMKHKAEMKHAVDSCKADNSKSQTPPANTATPSGTPEPFKPLSTKKLYVRYSIDRMRLKRKLKELPTCRTGIGLTERVQLDAFRAFLERQVSIAYIYSRMGQLSSTFLKNRNGTFIMASSCNVTKY